MGNDPPGLHSHTNVPGANACECSDLHAVVLRRLHSHAGAVITELLIKAFYGNGGGRTPRRDFGLSYIVVFLRIAFDG